MYARFHEAQAALLDPPAETEEAIEPYHISSTRANAQRNKALQAKLAHMTSEPQQSPISIS